MTTNTERAPLNPGAPVLRFSREYGQEVREVRVFYAVGPGYFGIGLSPEQAEEALLDNAERQSTVMREVFEADDTGPEEVTFYPNPKDRDDCVDFVVNAYETLTKREKYAARFREFGNMIRLPAGATHHGLNGMGAVLWDGPGKADRLTWDGSAWVLP